MYHLAFPRFNLYKDFYHLGKRGTVVISPDGATQEETTLQEVSATVSEETGTTSVSTTSAPVAPTGESGVPFPPADLFGSESLPAKSYESPDLITTENEAKKLFPPTGKKLDSSGGGERGLPSMSSPPASFTSSLISSSAPLNPFHSECGGLASPFEKSPINPFSSYFPSSTTDNNRYKNLSDKVPSSALSTRSLSEKTCLGKIGISQSHHPSHSKSLSEGNAKSLPITPDLINFGEEDPADKNALKKELILDMYKTPFNPLSSNIHKPGALSMGCSSFGSLPVGGSAGAVVNPFMSVNQPRPMASMGSLASANSLSLRGVPIEISRKITPNPNQSASVNSNVLVNRN